MFELQEADQSGVYFNNSIHTDDSLNAFSFSYVYNGGGIGISDFNNDGLVDIFFSANQQSCALYLNKGDFKFEEATKPAGLVTDRWCTGVSIVDINSDGLDDIYVSVGNHPSIGPTKANLLFVNKGADRGVPVFSEMAAEYGLDEKSYVSQSAFFDYDRDGDLDVYLLRNFPEKSANNLKLLTTDGSHPSTDKLLRNEGLTQDGHPYFVDVSKNAGITYSGYGLGVAISDLNKDGWPDIYCANDFISNDILYQNNHNGTFTNIIEDATAHSSYNAMGVDIADFNNDLLPDVLELDMLPEDNRRQKKMLGPQNYDRYKTARHLGYTTQYVRNCLQLNNGVNARGALSFSEIGQLAGIEKTDWSWSPLFVDLDNDGLKDVFISNGYRKDITDLDYIVYNENLNSCFGGDDKAKSISLKQREANMPEVRIRNYAYRNQGDLSFKNVSTDWGFDEISYSNGAAYADLDNDGDLDMVVNNIDGEAFIYKNNSERLDGKSNFLQASLEGEELNRHGIGTSVTIWANGKSQYVEMSNERGYKSSSQQIVHFGIGEAAKIDTLIVRWPDGKVERQHNVSANQRMRLRQRDAISLEDVNTPRALLFSDETEAYHLKFVHKENDAFIDFKTTPLLPWMHSRNGFGIAVGDINGDGLEDFFAGSANGSKASFFIQKKNGSFDERPLNDDEKHEDMGVLFFDADNDRDVDLYVASGSNELNPLFKDFYQDRLYVNDGHGKFKRATNALPAEAASGSSVCASDFDSDGDLDLFVGSRMEVNNYPRPGNSMLLRNDTKDGKIVFTDVSSSIAPALRKIGLVTSSLWTDFDNDNDFDLMVVGEWMPITIFRNDKGHLVLHDQLKDTSGFWNSLTAGDFDNDGDIDYVAGNIGENTRYHASPSSPVKIVSKDFNNDGLVDPIMGHYYEQTCHPSFSRDAMIQQMVQWRGRFKNYEMFASASYNDLFTSDQLKGAYEDKAVELRSVLIGNSGGGKFQVHALPIEAQFSSVYGMVVDDFNDDGNLDVMVTGNSFSQESQWGNLDAFTGLLLAGDGKNQFTAVKSKDSGLWAKGDSKGLVVIHNAQLEKTLISAVNNEGLRFYKVHCSSGKRLNIPAGQTSFFVELKNGKRRKQERYFGAGYLSSSSQNFLMTNSVAQVHF